MFDVQATVYKCNSDGTITALQAYSDADVSVRGCIEQGRMRTVSHPHYIIYACICEPKGVCGGGGGGG